MLSQSIRKKHTIHEAMQWTGKNDRELEHFCPHLQVMYRNGYIKTVEGPKRIEKNSYVIKDQNEFWAIEEDMFDELYEEVDVFGNAI